MTFKITLNTYIITYNNTKICAIIIGSKILCNIISMNRKIFTLNKIPLLVFNIKYNIRIGYPQYLHGFVCLFETQLMDATMYHKHTND